MVDPQPQENSSMKKKPQTKDATPDPKISKEELSDGDLNKVTGGIESLKVVKLVDAASPKIYDGK
jgi:hypothetical protein